MVDLHDALRPTDTTPPLPMSEITVRARRRRRQRRTRVAGLTTVALSLGGFAVANLVTSAPDQAVAADGAGVSGTADQLEPASGRSGTSSPPAEGDDPATLPDPDDTPADNGQDGDVTTGPGAGDPGDGATDDGADGNDGNTDDGSGGTGTGTTLPGATGSTSGPGVSDPMPTVPSTDPVPGDTVVEAPAGLRTEVTTTSAWEDGYCIRVRLDNDGSSPVTWRVALALDGSLASLWSATLEPADPDLGGALAFTGEPDYNTTLDPGAFTSFGMCLDT